MNNELLIGRPSDMHVHFRTGDVLQDVVRHTALHFARALVMPNLPTPVVTAAQARIYREQILAVLPENSRFIPYMTVYLTQATTRRVIFDAAQTDFVIAAKLYPQNATTGSAGGVSDISRLYAVFEEMQRQKLALSVHGEVTGATHPGVDIFDAERVFIDTVLAPIVEKFPDLKVVVEHVTTKEAVDFVLSSPETVAATITPQHLLYSRNDLFIGGIRPHLFCRPVLKRAVPHQQALVSAATSGSPKFFLGTDSAPHARFAKETACGCAGCFSAPCALSLYAQAFEAAGALEKLDRFSSLYGGDFYGLPRLTEMITLVREPWEVPAEVPFGTDTVIPLCAGETLNWRVIH
ncbi:MAG: dihydroorotase [Patescibacteria group bacterium]